MNINNIDNNTAEILLILQEECNEVSQAISKCFRFGFENTKPGDIQTNVEHLAEELGDLLCMIKLLKDREVVNSDIISEAQQNKLNKLRCWSNIFS